MFGLYAVASVAWWAITDSFGADDLRPYLLLQALALLLIPLWQAIHRRPRPDRIAFGIVVLATAYGELPLNAGLVVVKLNKPFDQSDLARAIGAAVDATDRPDRQTNAQ